MSTLRLGLIGAGRWGKAYIRTVAATEGMALAAVASGNPATASLLPAACKIVSDWRALIANPAVDAIVIATPPATHFAMTMAALDAGKPVLVEKPFTCDLGQAEALAKKARERKVPLMVEHTHLFSPAFRMLARELPRIGRVQSVIGRANAEGPIRPDVGVLWDWGPHDAAMCLALLGMPQRMSARRLEHRQGIDHAEMIGIALEWPERVTADIVIGNIASPKRRRFEIVGSEGSLIYDDMSDAKLVRAINGLPPETVPVEAESPLTAAVKAFASAVSKPFDDAGLDLAVGVVEILSECERRLAVSAEGSGKKPA